MDDKDLAQGNVGSVGKYDVAVKGNQLVVELDANAAIGSAGVNVKVGIGPVLDALAKAIPGTFDDAIIKLAKAAFGIA